jgi:hypothetical protein
MLHPLFFHPGLNSRHTPDALADAFGLVTAYKVEQDLQRSWRERTERSNPIDDKNEPDEV